LHVVGPDDSAVAGRIAVLDLTVIDDGLSLEAAMRVRTDAALLITWLEIRSA
jgi:hypothetical protein